MTGFSVRARLTALYGGLLLVSGVGLITLVYLLVQRELYPDIKEAFNTMGDSLVYAAPPPFEGAIVARSMIAVQSTLLERLLVTSGISLVAFALLSVVLAWWMAGRALRPVEAQRRFVANAAHELRTPLTVHRAALEIGLADPADAERVRRVRDELLLVVDRNERLIEGLLLLAGSDRGLDHREAVELDEIVRKVAADFPGPIRLDLEPATVDGDPVLLTHLVKNLVANAVTYNVPGGAVAVRMRPGLLEVVNTGPLVPAEMIPQLFEPFRRLQGRRHGPGEGTGLGLSIVASIARAHGASVAAAPNPRGGLTVRVRLR